MRVIGGLLLAACVIIACRVDCAKLRKTAKHHVNDDANFSGMNSDCNYDDEDDCFRKRTTIKLTGAKSKGVLISRGTVFHHGSPFYRGSSTTKRPPYIGHPCSDDDEEDCDDFSGAPSPPKIAKNPPSPPPRVPHNLPIPDITSRDKSSSSPQSRRTSQIVPQIQRNDPTKRTTTTTVLQTTDWRKSLGFQRPTAASTAVATAATTTARSNPKTTKLSSALNPRTSLPAKTTSTKPSENSTAKGARNAAEASPFRVNVGLIVGVVLGVVILLLLIGCAVYRYKGREEGTYKLDATENLGYEAGTVQTDICGSGCTGSKSKIKKKLAKEWYV